MLVKNEIIARRDLQALHQVIDGLLVPVNSENRLSDYEELFYSHLFNLFSVKLSRHKGMQANFKFNIAVYGGIEQFIFENPQRSVSVTNQEKDWEFADNAREIFKNRLKKLVGEYEAKEEPNSTLIIFTADCFQNWLVYQMMYPEVISNPWTPVLQIFQKGYLLGVVNDNFNIVEYFGLKRNPVSGQQANLCLLTQTLHKARKALVIDKRYSLQLLVYDFLKHQAPVASESKSLRQIADFLLSQSIDYTAGKVDEAFISHKVMAPLLKHALIGAQASGYYFNVSQAREVQPYQKMEGV